MSGMGVDVDFGLGGTNVDDGLPAHPPVTRTRSVATARDLSDFTFDQHPVRNGTL